MADTEKDFKVDISRIHLDRTPGISGMMRVKDDAEFIEACVESCISALDELVIVYNGCSDESPQIIRMMQQRYPDKIKVWEYTPKLICGSLTRQEYERAKSLPYDSVELLSNYYNFALARTTRTHVMKIDADQIYFTENLTSLCNRIRSAGFLRLAPADWLAFARIARKLRYLTWRPGDSSPKEFTRYRRVLEYLCAKGVFSPALSGINLYVEDGTPFVPQGLKTGGLNILGQFNGTADHLIFKVRKGTRFIPYDCRSYNVHTSTQYTYIERLISAPRALQWGFMWWHLNPMRCNLMDAQRKNRKDHPEAFTELKDFMRLTPEEITGMANPDFISPAMAAGYAFYWANCKNEIPEAVTAVKNLRRTPDSACKCPPAPYNAITTT